MPTLGGNPVNIKGIKLKIGDKAKDFSVLNNNLEPVSLSDFKQDITVISVVPSLDTSVCDQQTRRLTKNLLKKKMS